MDLTQSDLQRETDENILRLARQGDERCFLLLFERHREVVFRLAYRLAGSSVAEDITHDCFVSLLSGPARFDAMQGSLRTYLYGVVRNLARKHYWLHHSDTDFDEWRDESAAADPDATRLMLEQETSALVQEAILSLPIAQREALVLFQYEELSLEEIARILNVEAGTVKSRLHRARERLRRALAPHYERRNKNESVR
jgi:RNA polymerase sigma-70 factor (ECF subfamily)